MRLLRTIENGVMLPANWQGTTIEELVKMVDAFGRWYNETRIKISLGPLSPVEYQLILGIAAKTNPSFTPRPQWTS